MNDFYDFLTGPAAWAAFSIFIGGLFLRVVYLFGLSRERDRVFYNHADPKWALRSIFHWLIPLGSVSLRTQPLFAIAFFVSCLPARVPCSSAHNMLWARRSG